MELIITRRNGDQFTVLYDERDHDLIASYTWGVVEQTHTMYASRSYRIDGRSTRQGMHRLLIPGFPHVDHINGNGLDNRRENLRGCTVAENLRNRRSKSKVSGYKGVYPDGNGRWRARIMFDGTRSSLGVYDMPEQAAVAYDEAARELHMVPSHPSTSLHCLLERASHERTVRVGPGQVG